MLNISQIIRNINKPSLTEYFKDKIGYINELDLEYMIPRLLKENDFNNEYQCKLAINEYKKFLLLILINNNNNNNIIEYIIPSKNVDKIWHRHILHTNKYYNDCNYLLNSNNIIHHNPIPNSLDQYPTFHYPYYIKTKTLYKRIFNTNPPPFTWNIPSDSGGPPCESVAPSTTTNCAFNSCCYCVDESNEFCAEPTGPNLCYNDDTEFRILTYCLSRIDVLSGPGTSSSPTPTPTPSTAMFEPDCIACNSDVIMNVSGNLLTCDNNSTICSNITVTSSSITSLECASGINTSCANACFKLSGLPSGLTAIFGVESSPCIQFEANFVESITCHDYACIDGQFNISGMNMSLNCDGINACKEVSVSFAENLASIICDGLESCENLEVFYSNNSLFRGTNLDCIGVSSCININLFNAGPTLTPINCLNTDACNGGSIEYQITSDFTNFTVHCVGSRACANLKIVLNAPDNSSTVTVGRIVCNGIDACKGFTIQSVAHFIQPFRLVCLPSNDTAGCDTINIINRPSDSPTGLIML